MNVALYRLINRVNLKYAGILLLAVISLTVRLILFPEFGWRLQLTIFIISIISITIIWTILEFIDGLLNKHMPYQQGVIRRIVFQICIGLVCMYLYISLLIFFLADIFPITLDKILKTLAYVIVTLLILAVNGGSVGAYFFHEWKKAIIRNERLQKERALVQFDNLKNQLNPHFLFNSLTSLNSLIFENQQLASDFLQQLSKVFRYVLQNKEKELVSLETELTFIEHYISLLQTRFHESLRLQIKIPPQDRARQIVPVTLQILIENAIKHNIVNEQSPLTIHIFTAGDYLHIRNNLQKKSIIETSNKMGLENMKALYSFLSKKQVGITEDAMSFEVKIPLL
jgi:two-component system, LytTR family, sensor kinase